LTENYLYTREALEAYYDQLTDEGALAIIRWTTDIPRLVANATDFLSRRGMSIEDVGRHIVAVSSEDPSRRPAEEPPETVFLLSKSPLTPEKVDELLAGHEGLHVLHAPGRQPAADAPHYARLFSGQISFAEYADAFETLATPVMDDRPFYFATDK